MARPLRIEYPNAYYHVANKTESGVTLFPSEQYYQAFLQSVVDAAARLNVVVLGWTLLKTEYHLLIKTPEGNLSRFMRQVDGLYTQHYQRLKKKSGSVFRARYKSVVFQPELHLAPMSRYIHTLPRTIRQSPDSWPWSSLANYMVAGNKKALVNCAEVLALFGKGAAARKAYKAYLAQGNDSEITHFFGKKNQLSVLGDEKFRSKVRQLGAKTKVRGVSRGSEARKRPSASSIIELVAKTFKVTPESILKAARGPGSKNVPRWVAMYLCQEVGGITLQKIARQFGLQRYGTVSTTIGKLKDEFAETPALATKISKLRQKLSSQ